ncbi:MAG TPA: glycosyltransferase family 39 protein [Candidatus Dormibacteraeota bacterium]|nr:glycosyltransferase family 39 protein [Candidatus Dormibacteraeota bacterium]
MRAPIPWRWVGTLAAVKLAAHLLTAGNYGWHIDETYFVASANHLDWGYVDYPPLVPLLARLDQTVAPGSLVALRALAALAGAAIVILTALTARELGAGRRAQTWAALMALLSPMFLGANVLFHTTTFDELVWAVAIFVIARLLRDGDQRLWLVLGLVMGAGMETKYTITALAVALLIALLLTPQRRMLFSWWPWAGVAVAAVLLAPNLIWQATHAWISVQYTLSHRGHTDGPVAYWLQQLLLFDPLFLVPAAAGLWALRRDARFAPLPYLAAAVELVFFLSGGKAYYPGAVYPLAYAAGAMCLDGRLRRPVPVRLSLVAAVALTVLLLPIGLPVLPARTMIDSGVWKVRQDFASMLGGQELAAKTAAAFDSIPADQRGGAMIVAHYYGEAGPINMYGPALGLPQAVSPHLSYWYWAPPRMDPQTVVLVGYSLDKGGHYFATCRDAGAIDNSYGVENDFSGDPILVCTQPLQPLWKVWPELQTLD